MSVVPANSPSPSPPDPARFRRPVVQSEQLPLRLRIVSGYLGFTGYVGVAAFGVIGVLTLLGKHVLPNVTIPQFVSAVLMSASSIYASRALDRREKQGARVALGLFAAPFVYALLGQSHQGKVGVMGVLAMLAIISTWKELD